MSDQARGPQRSPGDYRPDLRPILILAGLLILVFVGWILLSGLVLPAPLPAPSPSVSP
jgi:hypothetical protein